MIDGQIFRFINVDVKLLLLKELILTEKAKLL